MIKITQMTLRTEIMHAAKDKAGRILLIKQAKNLIKRKQVEWGGEKFQSKMTQKFPRVEKNPSKHEGQERHCPVC